MKVLVAGLVALVGFLSVSNGSIIVKRSAVAATTPRAAEADTEWKSDVIDTLDTLKKVLVTFESKWDDAPLADGNDTLLEDQTNITKTLKDSEQAVRDVTEQGDQDTATQSAADSTVRNEFAKRRRRPILEDSTRRIQGGKILGCPHAWPHHDEYPVVEPLCDTDNDCKTDELCCQLFNDKYCLKALDATPRPGECRFTEFNFLASLHCLVDDPGCRYDSECSEPSWKCCQGPCKYKECFPSTVSPSPADLQKQQLQQRHQNDESSPSVAQPTVAGKIVALPPQDHVPKEQAAVVVSISEPQTTTPSATTTVSSEKRTASSNSRSAGTHSGVGHQNIQQQHQQQQQQRHQEQQAQQQHERREQEEQQQHDQQQQEQRQRQQQQQRESQEQQRQQQKQQEQQQQEQQAQIEQQQQRQQQQERQEQQQKQQQQHQQGPQQQQQQEQESGQSKTQQQRKERRGQQQRHQDEKQRQNQRPRQADVTEQQIQGQQNIQGTKQQQRQQTQQHQNRDNSQQQQQQQPQRKKNRRQSQQGQQDSEDERANSLSNGLADGSPLQWPQEMPQGHQQETRPSGLSELPEFKRIPFLPEEQSLNRNTDQQHLGNSAKSQNLENSAEHLGTGLPNPKQMRDEMVDGTDPFNSLGEDANPNSQRKQGARGDFQNDFMPFFDFRFGRFDDINFADEKL